jgi:hypothetical protein
MILAVVALASAVQYGEAAYIAGRCAFWNTPSERVLVVNDMRAIHPRLVALYEEGRRDSGTEPPPRAQCVKMLRDIKRELAR